MKIVDHIKNSKQTLFSLEVLPPLKGEDINSLFGAIEPLMEFKPPFIDVTYHREEYVYRKRENNLLEKVSTRKRPGTVGICAAIMNKFNVDAVPHIICGGFSKEETENALIDLKFLGIDNVLALRGDAIKSEGAFIAEKDGNAYATDLVEQIVRMNNGSYLYDDLSMAKTDFCVGVAAYPEKHFESPNLKTDIAFLKKKIELGAEYIVTQMFFDNQKFFEFVEICKNEGINVPIIPGLKPLTTKKQLTVLPSLFHIDLPETLVDAITNCKDNEQVKQVGVEWCIEQSKELKAKGIPVLHYYTMGKSDSTLRIAKAVF
jgi:methylenetetrahydrofolate reductase (NADPH)